jgi:hypothetical protein
MANQHVSVSDRLWLSVFKTSDYGCWVWTGRKQREGYGRIVVNGITTGVHRVAYEMAKGPIPDGMTIDHLCRNKACVNPAHMEVVSFGENSRRQMLSRTTCKHGHPWSFDNTRFDKRGRRCCRACARDSWHRKTKRHEEAA